MMKLGLMCIASALCLSATGMAADAQEAKEVRISQFSGKEVPRYESLRYAAANGRIGPSREHRVEWRYEREGLPMLIIKETRDWRRVRDPDGSEVWMHKRMLGGAETALVRRETELRRKPNAASDVTANLGEGVLVTLAKCEEGWCRIEAGGRKGWVQAITLWGVNTSEAGL